MPRRNYLDVIMPGKPGDTAAALLFVTSMSNAIDVFSATNSSPWTAENFGGDADKVKSLRGYVCHAVALTALTNGVGAYVAKNPWPLVGAGLACGYMIWLYERAVHRGMESGSTGWANDSSSDVSSPVPSWG